MAGDSNWSSVALLLPFGGADGFASTVDKGPIANAVSVNGAATISTAQSKFGPSSMKFSLGGSLTIASAAAFGFGPGDLTIEGWVYLTANAISGGNTIVDFRTTAGVSPWVFFVANTGSGNYLGTYLSTTPDCTSGANYLALNTWYHIAITRASGTWRLFIDGVQVGTASNSIDLGSSKPLTIGNVVGGTGTTSNFPGYIDDLRVTKGVARYTANFTPPATAFVAGMGQVSGAIRDDTGALCARLVRAYRRDTGTLVGQAYTQAGDSNIANVVLLLHLDGVNGAVVTSDSSPYARTVTFVGDAKLSSARSKFGASSLALDGSGDYLTVPWSSAFSIEASDFNIAMWVYRAASGVSQYLMSGRPAASTDGWEWRINATNYLQFFYTGGSSITGAVAVPSGQWCLVEVNRSGTSLTMWVDGVAAGSGTVSNGTASTATTLKIGCDNVAANGFNGWIDEVRFTKGVSRNTVAYTPPTDRYPDNSLSVGNYSFDVPTLDEVNIIAYDDAAGTLYNDQILRVIPA